MTVVVPTAVDLGQVELSVMFLDQIMVESEGSVAIRFQREMASFATLATGNARAPCPLFLSKSEDHERVVDREQMMVQRMNSKTVNPHLQLGEKDALKARRTDLDHLDVNSRSDQQWREPLQLQNKIISGAQR